VSKAKQKQTVKCDNKMIINGCFEHVIKVMVTSGNPAPVPKPVKPPKKKL